MVFLYTGGPYPIAYSPFGEIVSGAVMGMGIVLIAFYIQTLTVTLDAILLSVPSMILVGGIMLSNNIRDIVGDTEGGRKTLAILVGRDRAISVLSGFFIVSYLWVLALVAIDGITFWALIIFLSVPKPLRAIQIFRDKKRSQRSNACDEVYSANKYNFRLPIRSRSTDKLLFLLINVRQP